MRDTQSAANRTAIKVKLALTLSLLAICMTGCDSQPDVATAESRPSTTEPAAPVSAPEEVPKAPLRPGAKTVALARAGDRLHDKTFDDLRFEMKPEEKFERSMLTPAIEELAGDHIRIRGFILPTAQQRGIKQFVLVRDNQECCFGPGAAVFDCILVDMRGGKTVEYSLRPVAVSGTFDIREFKGPDDRHLAIYHLAADEVE